MSEDGLAGFPSRQQIAGLVLLDAPNRDSYAGWQHYRRTRDLLVPPPRLSPAQWRALPPARREDFDEYRRMTNVNLPLQETPMAANVIRLVRRRLRGNTLKKSDPTLAGVMVSGWGQHGKTATVCQVASLFEDQWLRFHQHANPNAVPGTLDLHCPIVYVQVPVTAKPKSTCETILNFFNAPTKGLTLPQLVRQVAHSLHDHGVKALILDFTDCGQCRP
jgi:hypothetical protein